MELDLPGGRLGMRPGSAAASWGSSTVAAIRSPMAACCRTPHARVRRGAEAGRPPARRSSTSAPSPAGPTRRTAVRGGRDRAGRAGRARARRHQGPRSPSTPGGRRSSPLCSRPAPRSSTTSAASPTPTSRPWPARHGAGLVTTHARSRRPEDSARSPGYEDRGRRRRRLVPLGQRIETALQAGVRLEQIIVDPGPDYTKTPHETHRGPAPARRARRASAAPSCSPCPASTCPWG